MRKAAERYAKKNRKRRRAIVKRYAQRHSEKRKDAAKKYRKKRKNRLMDSCCSWSKKINAAFNYNPKINYEADTFMDFGEMDVVCKWCRALRWKDETPGMCCDLGKVKLQPYKKLLDPLKSLLLEEHEERKHFLRHIRMYNSSFQMTSFGAKQILKGGWESSCVIKGQVYHRIGSLLPEENGDPKFLQIYFVGEDQLEAEYRCDNFPRLREHLVLGLQQMLHHNNSYVRELKTAIQRESQKSRKFEIFIHGERKFVNAHKGRLNRPVLKEIAVVIEGQEFGNRDIVLESQGGSLRRVSELHRSYDALQYPLMFARGEEGYIIYYYY